MGPAGLASFRTDAQACVAVCRPIHRGTDMEACPPRGCRRLGFRRCERVGRRGRSHRRCSVPAEPNGVSGRTRPVHLRHKPQRAKSFALPHTQGEKRQKADSRLRQSCCRHTPGRSDPGAWHAADRDDQHGHASAGQRHLLRAVSRDGGDCRSGHPDRGSLLVSPPSDSSLRRTTGRPSRTAR
jgi:hypothetical protein